MDRNAIPRFYYEKPSGENVFVVPVEDVKEGFEAVLDVERFIRVLSPGNVVHVDGTPKAVGAQYKLTHGNLSRSGSSVISTRSEHTLTITNIDAAYKRVDFDLNIARQFSGSGILELHLEGHQIKPKTEVTRKVHVEVERTESGKGGVARWSMDGPNLTNWCTACDASTALSCFVRGLPFSLFVVICMPLTHYLSAKESDKVKKTMLERFEKYFQIYPEPLQTYADASDALRNLFAGLQGTPGIAPSGPGSVPVAAAAPKTKEERLTELFELHKNGAISYSEFEKLKAEVI